MTARVQARVVTNSFIIEANDGLAYLALLVVSELRPILS